MKRNYIYIYIYILYIYVRLSLAKDLNPCSQDTSLDYTWKVKLKCIGVVGFIHARSNIYLKLLSFQILIYSIIIIVIITYLEKTGISLLKLDIEHPHIAKMA